MISCIFYKSCKLWPKKKRDRRTYEQTDAERIRDAIKSLDPLIHEAVTAIHIGRAADYPYFY